MGSAERADRRIVLLRPPAGGEDKSTHSMQLLESMLWAFQGTTRSNWVTASGPEAADVIVVNDTARNEQVAGWRERGKAVLVLASTLENAQPHEHVLVYPFRATEVLQMLNRLDAQLTRAAEQAAGTAPPPEPQELPGASTTPEDPWAFLEAMRTLREVQNQDVWLAGRLGQRTVLWLKGDSTEYAADAATVQSIRLGQIKLHRVKLTRDKELPSHRAPRPSAELSWYAAYHAGTQLAPWIAPNAAYRIKRWPNFGAIRPLPSQIRMTALLAGAAFNVEQMARRAQIAVPEAIRTLNALSACELLVAMNLAAGAAVAPVPAPRVAKAPQPAGGLKSFLKLMRKRLGIGEPP